MKYLKISNKGLIEVEAFTLVGASTKRGDSSKIGMFGSGNKYAISYLIRNNYELIVYSGHDLIEFSTNEKKFRDEVFNVISVNGKETSITTEMGHKWKLWQSIRELYSNAIDEGLTAFEVVENISIQKDDETTIYISLNYELEDFMINIDEYIIQDRKPLYECELGAIYKKTGKKARIYRKGIKVYDTENDALFDYDLSKIDIDEDRMAQYYWQVSENIWNIIYSTDSSYIIRRVLDNIKNDNLIENGSGTQYADKEISPEWYKALENKQIFSKNMAGWLNGEELLKTILLPGWLYSKLISEIGDMLKPKSLQSSTDGKIYEEVDINDLRAKILSDAMGFFTDAKFSFDYKIKVVDFKRKDILGSIDKENQLILLDIKSIDKGVDEVVNTVIEEYIHLKYGVADETRGFQTAIITELVNYMKGRV